MINRQEQIRKKGFQMSPMRDTREKYSPSMDPNFSKIKVGLKTLDDAIVNVGDYKQIDDRLADKKEVLRAIHENDEETMRDISEFFYKTSGIYSRLCRYMANLYRYDWLVTPYINSDSVKSDKILSGFNNVLTYLDNFEIKKFFGGKSKNEEIHKNPRDRSCARHHFQLCSLQQQGRRREENEGWFYLPSRRELDL